LVFASVGTASATFTSLPIDGAGNMVTRPGQTLVYDEESQLKQVNSRLIGQW
jgi:hypothetical protein